MKKIKNKVCYEANHILHNTFITVNLRASTIDHSHMTFECPSGSHTCISGSHTCILHPFNNYYCEYIINNQFYPFLHLKTFY